MLSWEGKYHLGRLKEIIELVETKDKSWKEEVKGAEEDFSEDIIEALNIVGKTKSAKSQSYQDALKLLKARVNNLESNLHIEIDMERIEDKSKALSYIGIEVADALKVIPTPVEEAAEVPVEENVKVNSSILQEPATEEMAAYTAETTFEAKPSLWQRIKNSKLVRAVSYVMKIRVRIELPNALPEGRGE